jgi:hypothetical protein
MFTPRLKLKTQPETPLLLKLTLDMVLILISHKTPSQKAPVPVTM